MSARKLSRQAFTRASKASLSLVLAFWVIIGAGTSPSLAQRASNTRDLPVADNILIITADIYRHLGEDPYRFPPPTDVVGQNVFRAGLVRLANWEKLNPGKSQDIVAMAKAFCWERLGAIAEARSEYENAETKSPSPNLKRAAAEGKNTMERFLKILAVPVDQSIPRVFENQLRTQSNDLDQLARSLSSQPSRAALARVLRERVDIRLAEFLAAIRFVSPYTTQDAIEALRENTRRHANSRMVKWHKLRLAEFYIELAKEYCIRFDPDGPDFVLQEFLAYCEPARKLLQDIERADGFPEKPEARHRLAALDSFISATTDRAR
jgi:hypothetical protein